MITRIDATNYRCFENISVPMRDFCVIAGANGSGKTTLLDIPILLGDLLRSRNIAAAFMERLTSRGARAGTLSEIPFRSQRDNFSVGVEAKLPAELQRLSAFNAGKAVEDDPEKWPTHVRYELRLELDDAQRQLQVKNEYLFLFTESSEYQEARIPIQGENAERKGWIFIIERSYSSETEFSPEAKGGRGRSAEVDDTLPAFARLQYEAEADFPVGRWFMEHLLTGLTFFDPKWTELRAASRPGLPKELMSSGENLPWLALELHKDDPERFGYWIEHVRTALPQIVNIEIKEREEDHHAYFRVSYEGGFQVTSSGLSEGTLRIMALTLIAYIKRTPHLLVVEEPENSIHPQAVDTIMQSLRSFYRDQVWVSTHSPVVLADRDIDELVITRLGRDGAAEVIAGPQHPRLADWQGGIDLGSLFATGVFE